MSTFMCSPCPPRPSAAPSPDQPVLLRCRLWSRCNRVASRDCSWAPPVDAADPAARVAADGSFALSGIAPGQYTLIARPPPIARGVPGAAPVGPSAASLSTMWAQADITIDGRDASVAVDLQPGMTISGRLVFEGRASRPTNLTGYRIVLIPPGSGGNLGAGPAGGQVDADGRFTFTGVTPGEYRVLELGSPSPASGV